MADSYEAALRSDRYHADPFSGDGDAIPGEPLAIDISAELRQSGYSEVRILDESPLWVLRVRLDDGDADIDVSLFLPSEKPHEAVWNVSIPSRRGLLDRLLGRPEPEAIQALARAVHDALERIPGVSNIRWFRKWPADPYKAESYSVRPEV